MLLYKGTFTISDRPSGSSFIGLPCLKHDLIAKTRVMGLLWLCTLRGVDRKNLLC